MFSVQIGPSRVPVTVTSMTFMQPPAVTISYWLLLWTEVYGSGRRFEEWGLGAKTNFHHRDKCANLKFTSILRHQGYLNCKVKFLGFTEKFHAYTNWYVYLKPSFKLLDRAKLFSWTVVNETEIKEKCLYSGQNCTFNDKVIFVIQVHCTFNIWK